MRYFLVLFLMLLAIPVMASDFKIVPPEANEDGSMIEFPYDIGYVMHCDNDPGEPYAISVDVGVKLPGPDNIIKVPIGSVLPISIGIKKWYCAAQAYYVFDSGNKSRLSNEIFFVAADGKTIISVTPSAPKLTFGK